MGVGKNLKTLTVTLKMLITQFIKIIDNLIDNFIDNLKCLSTTGSQRGYTPVNPISQSKFCLLESFLSIVQRHYAIDSAESQQLALSVGYCRYLQSVHRNFVNLKIC